MNNKIIKILINEDGTVEFDQIGWEGKSCSGDIQDLINALGKEKKVTKKQEYYKDNKVRIQQSW
jgi:hypothetical protein